MRYLYISGYCRSGNLSVHILIHVKSTVGTVGRCQILLENKISIFKKLVSRRKHEVLQNVLVNGCSDVGFQKNTMDQHQQMTLQPKSSQTVET